MTNPGDSFHWDVPGVDAAGRPRTLRVGIRDGYVILLPPPGEGFRMDPDGTDILAASASAAAHQARMHRQANP